MFNLWQRASDTASHEQLSTVFAELRRLAPDGKLTRVLYYWADVIRLSPVQLLQKAAGFAARTRLWTDHNILRPAPAQQISLCSATQSMHVYWSVYGQRAVPTVCHLRDNLCCCMTGSGSMATLPVTYCLGSLKFSSLLLKSTLVKGLQQILQVIHSLNKL